MTFDDGSSTTKTKHINTIMFHDPDDEIMIEKVKCKQNHILTDKETMKHLHNKKKNFKKIRSCVCPIF